MELIWFTNAFAAALQNCSATQNSIDQLILFPLIVI